jgi:hypothetical protein
MASDLDDNTTDRQVDDNATDDTSTSELSPLEVLVFAPLGLLLKAGELLPGLVESGRREYNKRAPTARFMGKMIVQQQRRKRQSALVRSVGDRAVGDRPGGHQSGGHQSESIAPVPQPPHAGVTEAVAPSPVILPSGAPSVTADELPIDGYDTMPARSLLPLLDGLTADQLETVLQYEQSHRRRATVLNRLTELLG